MKELVEIIKAYEGSIQSNRAFVLGTVVSTTGSTYRGPGAHMFIQGENEFVGSISGGCVEHDVIAQAVATMDTGKSRLLTYDTTDEDDILWGMGLGCSGIVEAMLEPSDLPATSIYLEFLNQCLASHTLGVAALLYHASNQDNVIPGQRLLLDEKRVQYTDIGDASVEAALLESAGNMLENLIAHPWSMPKGETVELKTDHLHVKAVFTPIVPPVDLTIFGAGIDALPVIQLAKILGWEVTVVDHRPAYAQSDRLLQADHVIEEDYTEAVRNLGLTARSVVLVMTHHYLNDKKILTALSDTSLAYLGLLGPVKRSKRLLDELVRASVSVQAYDEGRLFSPAGLDIGAETPEDVALAIISEIRAVLSDRKGGPLRERKGAIHDR